jgi:hypothetical protein
MLNTSENFFEAKSPAIFYLFVFLTGVVLSAMVIGVTLQSRESSQSLSVEKESQAILFSGNPIHEQMHSHGVLVHSHPAGPFLIHPEHK